MDCKTQNMKQSKCLTTEISLNNLKVQPWGISWKPPKGLITGGLPKRILAGYNPILTV